MSAFAQNGKVFLSFQFEVFVDEPELAIKSLPANSFSPQADSRLGIMIRSASARALPRPAPEGSCAVSCLCEAAGPASMDRIDSASAELWNCRPDDLSGVCCEDLAFEALAVLNGLPSPTDLGYSFVRTPGEFDPRSCFGRALLDCLFESAQLKNACPAQGKKHGGISL